MQSNQAALDGNSDENEIKIFQKKKLPKKIVKQKMTGYSTV